MKNTATSSTVVGALVITIMFTVAITVPEGNNQNTGFPMFSHKKSFMVFIITDALSLFRSTMSIFLFLEILTLPYSEDEFLKRIPTKMIWGYYALFFSIVTMMIAFCFTLFIILPQKTRMVIPVFFLAYIPVWQLSSVGFKLIDPLLLRLSTSDGAVSRLIRLELRMVSL